MSQPEVELEGRRVGFSWEVLLNKTKPIGEWDEHEPVARAHNLPVPRVGETIFVETINGPLTVTAVVWNMRNDYPLLALVYVDQLLPRGRRLDRR